MVAKGPWWHNVQEKTFIRMFFPEHFSSRMFITTDFLSPRTLCRYGCFVGTDVFLPDVLSLYMFRAGLFITGPCVTGHFVSESSSLVLFIGKQYKHWEPCLKSRLNFVKLFIIFALMDRFCTPLKATFMLFTNSNMYWYKQLIHLFWQ